MDGDECFLDTMGFGYTQTQPESPIGEQPTPSTQHQATPSTQQRSAITEKAKSNKGKNWSSDEDKVLIAAWANTSLDIIGTDQTEMLIGLEFQSTTTHTRNHHGRSVMLMQ